MNWKAVEAKENIEKNSNKLQKEAVTEVQSSVKTRLSAAFPDVQAEDFDDFVAAVAESASQSTGDNEEIAKLQQELGAAKESESRLSNQVQALQQSLDGALQRNKTLEADLSDREETIVAKENAADSYSLILQSAESDMKRIQEEAATQHQQNEEKLKNAQEEAATQHQQNEEKLKNLDDKEAKLSSVSQEKSEGRLEQEKSLTK